MSGLRFVRLTDEPVQNAGDDLLGFKEVASGLAGVLTLSSEDDWGQRSAVVVAIKGAPGGGKSSMANLVIHALCERQRANPPLVVCVDAALEGCSWELVAVQVGEECLDELDRRGRSASTTPRIRAMPSRAEQVLLGLGDPSGDLSRSRTQGEIVSRLNMLLQTLEATNDGTEAPAQDQHRWRAIVCFEHVGQLGAAQQEHLVHALRRLALLERVVVLMDDDVSNGATKSSDGAPPRPMDALVGMVDQVVSLPAIWSETLQKMVIDWCFRSGIGHYESPKVLHFSRIIVDALRDFDVGTPREVKRVLTWLAMVFERWQAHDQKGGRDTLNGWLGGSVEIPSWQTLVPLRELLRFLVSVHVWIRREGERGILELPAQPFYVLARLPFAVWTGEDWSDGLRPISQGVYPPWRGEAAGLGLVEGLRLARVHLGLYVSAGRSMSKGLIESLREQLRLSWTGFERATFKNREHSLGWIHDFRKDPSKPWTAKALYAYLVQQDERGTLTRDMMLEVQNLVSEYRTVMRELQGLSAAGLDGDVHPPSDTPDDILVRWMDLAALIATQDRIQLKLSASERDDERISTITLLKDWPTPRQ